MKAISVSFMMLMIVTCVWSIGMSGERYATDGLEYYQRGDYKNAIEMFKAANQAADNKKPEYLFWLGRLNIAVQDTANARHWLNKYNETTDKAFAPQVNDYLDILNRQTLIFEKADTRQLPHYMNSRNSDYGAVITPDGKYVYLTSLRPTVFEKENIWKAERLNNNWGKPALVEELSTEKNESVSSFSSDGKIAYLSGNYSRGKIDGDIYTSEFKGKWTTPVNLTAVNSPQVDVQPYVYDDKWMFFTSSREGGLGGTDIYVSVYENGAWQQPVNLGPAINTADNEQTPFLDWDGSTLFFASNGHAGFGGYDLFKAVKIGPDWTAWSAPENLGLPLNSVKNDRYYYHHKDSNEAFISTDRSAEGFENILFADVVYAPSEYLIVDKETGDKQTVVVADTVTTPPPVDTVKVVIPEPEPEPVFVRNFGTVKNEAGNPLQADVEFNYTLKGMKYKEVARSDENGIYEITLPYAPAYNVVVNEEGYFIFTQDTRPAKTGGELKFDIILKSMEVKKVFVFNNIQFEFDSSYLTDDSYPVVNEIALTLINNPEIKVEISGHTCNMGSDKYNQWMSEERAQRIVNYLITKGVEKERMTFAGYGESKPIADNSKIATRKLNRRVEVKVME